MAFPDLARAGSTPPLYRMVKDGLIKDHIFAFWLRAMADDKEWGEHGGEVELGGYSEDRFVGDLNWIPIHRKPYWELKLSAGYLEGGPKYSGKIVIDSGTSLIIAPRSIVSAMNDQFLHGTFNSDSGYYMIGCSKISSLPNLSFELGDQGHKFTLSPQQYIIQFMGECYSTISGMDISTHGGQVWILGDAFLRHHYAVFDADKERVGLARSR
jgi:Eukaryotic aspartyl protease